MSFPTLCFLCLPLLRAARILAAALLLLSISSRDVLAGSGTLHPSAINAQQAPTCEELIVNGGFESAGSAWTPVANSSLFSYAAEPFVSGNHSLLLGFADSSSNMTATFGVEQSVILPAESSSIEFSFYYDIRVDGAASPGDQAGFVIYDTVTDQPVATQLLPTIPSGSWSTGHYDLTALAGSEIRLVFAVQNDGEPGRLAMYLDDVSILACRPPSALPLAPLTEPEIPYTSTQALPLSPQLVPTSPQLVPVSPQVTPLFPQVGTIDSLDGCSCAGSLYTCNDFSNWSVAQACYVHCQATVGFDIHGLDEDRNGIACELELKDVAPLDAATSEPASPALDDTSVVTSSAALSMTDVATPSVPLEAVPTMGSLTILPPPVTITATPSVAITISATATLTSTAVSTVAVSTAAATMTSTASVSEVVAVAEVATPTEELVPTEPSAMEVTFPITVTEVGILLIMGLLSLVIAYMAGQRRTSVDK